jgi:peptidoglycan L-alanyl-D-glutamate endopeptidase CwlK
MNLDTVTLKRANLLHPKLRTEAIALYGQVACALTGKAFCRFDLTLKNLCGTGCVICERRTKPGPKVTNAKGGQSYHCYGLAIDYFLVTDRDGDGNYDKAEWDIVHDFDGDGVADWIEVEKGYLQKQDGSGAVRGVNC